MHGIDSKEVQVVVFAIVSRIRHLSRFILSSMSAVHTYCNVYINMFNTPGEMFSAISSVFRFGVQIMLRSIFLFLLSGSIIGVSVAYWGQPNRPVASL